jgi:hypothetical protein
MHNMGYVKEPDEIDFIINGKPLTDKEKQSISKFIKADKAKNSNSIVRTKNNSHERYAMQ